MSELWGSSRRQGALARSAGPQRWNPLAPPASASKWLHWVSELSCAPASSNNTSSPRAASSLATMGPPPPAPITMTSRISFKGRGWILYHGFENSLLYRAPPALEVAFEIVASIRESVVAGDGPPHRRAIQRAKLWTEES